MDRSTFEDFLLRQTERVKTFLDTVPETHEVDHRYRPSKYYTREELKAHGAIERRH